MSECRFPQPCNKERPTR